MRVCMPQPHNDMLQVIKPTPPPPHFPALYSRNPPPMRTENRLIVENLSSRVSWQVSIPHKIFIAHFTNAATVSSICLQHYTHIIVPLLYLLSLLLKV